MEPTGVHRRTALTRKGQAQASSPLPLISLPHRLMTLLFYIGVAVRGERVLVPSGGTVALRCPIASHNVDWAMVIASAESAYADYAMIVEDCQLKPEYESLYDVESSGRCDLLITNVRKPHGGRYVCYDEDGRISPEFLLSVLGNHQNLIDKKLHYSHTKVQQNPMTRDGVIEDSVTSFLHPIFLGGGCFLTPYSQS